MSPRVATVTLTEKPPSNTDSHGTWRDAGYLALILLLVAILGGMRAGWRALSRAGSGLRWSRPRWDAGEHRPALPTAAFTGAAEPRRPRVRVLPATRAHVVVVRAARVTNRLCPFCGLPLDQVDHRPCQRGEFE